MSPSRRFMPTVRAETTPTSHQERAVALEAAGWGGAELRPTRVFFWLGGREQGREWLLPLTRVPRQPRLLRRPRHRRHLSWGPRWQVSYLGNPLVTLTLVAYGTIRHVLRETKAGSSEAVGSVSRRDA